MGVKTYLNFNGNCREAVEFYAEVFEAEKPKIMLFGDMPSNGETLSNDSIKHLVLHAEVKIDEDVIMFSDTMPGSTFNVGNNINLIFSSREIDEIKAVFHKLKADGKIIMELQETFFSKCYGYLIDKFGVGWQFNLEG